MKATLIFNSVNDLVYSKWDETFLQKISFGEQESNENLSDSHNLSQLLSPIITSQRVMAAQFGNTYSSMQCKDNTSIVFDEWLDHVFMIISEDVIDDAHRELLDCKTFVQHICGQNIGLLHLPTYQQWLSVLLDSRGKGDSIPGASGLIGESGATVAALNALKTASKDTKCSPYQHYHVMLFVGDKLLALYSSRGSEDLSPPDLILISTQCIAAQEYWKDVEKPENCNTRTKLPWLSSENSGIVNVCGGAAGGPCAPHSLHLAELAPRITFAVLIDMELREVGIATQISNQILSNLRRLLLQRNLEMLPNSLDSLEGALKKTTDALRKNKSNASLCSRLSTRLLELRRACSTTTPLTPETTAAAMHTALEAVIEQLKPDIPSLKIEVPMKELTTALTPYFDFLRVKAMRYFTMGSGDSESGSLTLHKYVEEFPGLIHFVYIDRGAGRFLAPDMADCADMLSPETIRKTLRLSLRVVREGYTGSTWRAGGGAGGGAGGALHACHVLWWERRGAPVRPSKPPHPAAVRALPPPGDVLGSFYRQLVELAFPGVGQGVCVKELVCIHLGLLPAAAAVAQARRLAHAVADLPGAAPLQPRPYDLL